jgi:HSP20 family molecular chaperone IbpA
MNRIIDPRDSALAWRRQAGTSGPPVDLDETSDVVVIRPAIPNTDCSSLSLTIGEESVRNGLLEIRLPKPQGPPARTMPIGFA